MLPLRPLATDEVTVNGETVTIRALSRAEVIQLGKIRREDGDSDIFAIACATGETVESVTEWFTKVDNETAYMLASKVMKLSAMVDRDNPNP